MFNEPICSNPQCRHIKSSHHKDTDGYHNCLARFCECQKYAEPPEPPKGPKNPALRYP